MSKTTDTTSDVQVYRRLLSYVRPYWFAFFLSIVGYGIYSIANLGFVNLIGFIIDSLGGNSALSESPAKHYIEMLVGSGDNLDRTIIPIMIIFIAIFRGIGTLMGNYFISIVSTNLVHNLRVEIFERLLVLPSRFYDKNSMGHLVAKVTFHVTQVAGAATNAVQVLIREGFTVVAYVAYLFYLNWKLTFIFLAVAPLIAIVVGFASRRFRRISERIQDSMGDVTHVASEAMQGYREVRTFGGTAYEQQRFNKVSNDNRRQSMKMVITTSVSTPVVQILVAIAMAVLVWLALDPKLIGNMTGGKVIEFIVAGGLLAKPIRQLSQINATIQKGLAAAKDIFTLFDEPVEADEGQLSLEGVKGKIEFRNVTFAYDDSDTPVLKNVSFIAEPGETIALVGRSGSGKSTLASLILRFYTPQSGTILIDDKPINNIRLKSYRHNLAIVTQDVTLFNDTVSNNIAYGALRNASDSAVRNAAEQAYAWPFIQSLDLGMETVVGDDGVLLSGGQKQRLAIARAFLKDAPILILDEATSALDTESERYIQAALENIARNRTTIVIAHRLSTIENADKIIVLDSGEIIEQGSHAELMANGEHYAGLHDHQLESKERPLAKDLDVILGSAGEVSQDKQNPLLIHTSRLQNAWYGHNPWLKLLLPLSYVFDFAATFQRRRTRPWHGAVPIIVVGNITVGGTGKSPLVSWLVQTLKNRGFNPGIVSRGYGGESSVYPLSVSKDSNPTEGGDEAVMLAQQTTCPVIVDPNRVEAVKFLLSKYNCDIVISDDGLQHYALARDIEIAVIDGSRGLGNGYSLPAGPLRESASRLQEVDFVVINGETDHQVQTNLDSVLNRQPYKMDLKPKNLINLITGDSNEVRLQTSKIHGVAGIGNPSRFFNALRHLGYDVIEHAFGDHQSFCASDLDFGDGLPVIMTEKDAVKCRLLNLAELSNEYWFLSVEALLPEKLVDLMLDALKLKQPSSHQSTTNQPTNH